MPLLFGDGFQSEPYCKPTGRSVTKEMLPSPALHVKREVGPGYVEYPAK